MPRRLLDSSKDGELTSSCWKLCQGSVTSTVKKSFLMFHGHCPVIEWCHQLPLVILRTYHEGKNIDYGYVTEEFVREIAQVAYEKGWTSKGWQVDMKKGKEKLPVRQATPLFFLVLCIAARCLDRGTTSSKYPPVFYLLKIHHERGQLFNGQIKQPCHYLAFSHRIFLQPWAKREIPSVFCG